MDRDRSYLLNEAVESYLSEQRRFAAMVEEGLEASRRGELIDDEDVGRMIESWVTERGRERGIGSENSRRIQLESSLDDARCQPA